MTNDEFRRHGYEVIDWIARYLETVEQYPVLAQVEPGQIRAQLPSQAPDEPEAFDALLADFERVILPGITHWQSPNFFAFFPSNNSGPSILADMLSSGLGIQGMLWMTSPACTELETHVLDWMADMLGLPAKFKSDSPGGGVIQDSASSASLCALLAARERATQYETRRLGVAKRLVAYASEHAHSSIEKAMNIAGLGTENLRKIPCDERFQMRTDALLAAIQTDLAAEFTPCFVSATVGTTSCGSVDPLPAIGEICRQFGLWMHVDGAMAGTAALCPEFRWIHQGLAAADSYCFNPHKWMFVNFDCDCLGRRFRALKLWFVIRSFGVHGLQQRVRQHVALAQQFAAWIAADPDFELAAPAPLNLVCFRHRGGDALNQQIMDRLNQSGQLYLSHTRLADKLTLRMSIGQTNTQLEHVERAWRLIRAAGSNVQNSIFAGTRFST
ncbi:MAG: aminotransferase class V-fold PLP-dependent enzyme [Pirellulaceae bacterium]|nr:aminotransferase class V-fold PLP-dependent enzyme [Pirellulaceae bacterium]